METICSSSWESGCMGWLRGAGVLRIKEFKMFEGFEGFEMFQGFQVFQGYRCFKVTQLQCHAGSCFVVPSRNDYDEGTGLQFV